MVSPNFEIRIHDLPAFYRDIDSGLVTHTLQLTTSLGFHGYISNGMFQPVYKNVSGALYRIFNGCACPVRNAMRIN